MLTHPLPGAGLENRSMNEQYAELAELAGGFIHEIKNHLSTLGLNLQLLVEDFNEAENPRERRALTRILKVQSQCQHLIEVSNDFLRFARINNLNVVPTDIGPLVEEMVDFFAPTARAANIEIRSYVPADLPTVCLEVDLFKQALLNLMLNAEQAMPDGGELTIQAHLQSTPPTAELAQEHCPNWVSLQLIDTGKGMCPETLKRIFQPFYSTKQGGSGLGLPTTRRIVEAHGGIMTVESEVGRGSKFSIALPVPQTANNSDNDKP